MGKVNKRQRKFLSKKVLPHRRKGGARRDGKAKKDTSKGGREDAPAPAAGEQQRKTLPDGVDTAAFLECKWLSRDVCAAAGRDACVGPFEPDAAFLEGARAQAKRSKSGKGTKHGSGLTEEAARYLIAQAIENESIDDLLRVVWALQAASTTTTTATPSSSSSPATGQALRAEPGSQAVKALRKEAFSRLHLAFRAHLGPEREEGDSAKEWEDAVRAHRQQLEKAEAWPQLGGPLLTFLTTALDHMEVEAETSIPALAAAASTTSKSSSARAAPLVEALARMKDHVPLLFPFPRLARRYLVFLLSVLELADDAPTLSLAFVRVYELATSQPMPFLHDAFKGSYRCYRAAAGRIGAARKGTVTAVGAAGGKKRNDGAGSLPLLRECFAELFGVEKPSAYLHAYVYIHELAREALTAAAEVQKAGGKTTREAGPALRRLRSWGFLQSLQLWTSVVAAHPAKSSLGPLVPPLAKALEITLQLSPGVFGAPRTLALARGAQDLAAASGVFLPTSHHLVALLELLHAREGRQSGAGAGQEPAEDITRGRKGDDGGGSGGGGGKKRGRGRGAEAGGVAVDLSAVAGLGKEHLRLEAVRAAVTKAAAGLIAREAVCYRWSAGLPELCASTTARLGRLLNGGGGGLAPDGGAGAVRCRARMRALQATLEKAAAEAAARRARGSKHPGEAGPVDTFRGMEESTATQRLRLFKEPS
eukprot:g14945.t1